MVIKSLASGEVLRLKDVARIELGSRTYTYIGEVNGHPGSNCMIAQTSGSNANEIIEEVDKVVAEISKSLPKGMELVDLMSSKDFLDASIKNVIKTLVEAILLVIFVVYVFLQSMRSTLIPSISIIVSLIGTFAFLYAAGFSLNMLTLFALVLVIGTVVDDAIVVVEAVQAKFDEGYKSSYLATVDAMGGITSALITTTFCFHGSVYTCLFHWRYDRNVLYAVRSHYSSSGSDLNGQCVDFKSGIVRFDYDPSRDWKRRQNEFSSRFHMAFDTAFHRIVMKYKTGVFLCFKHKWLAGVLLVIAGAGLFILMKNDENRTCAAGGYGNYFCRCTYFSRNEFGAN